MQCVYTCIYASTQSLEKSCYKILLSGVYSGTYAQIYRVPVSVLWSYLCTETYVPCGVTLSQERKNLLELNAVQTLSLPTHRTQLPNGIVRHFIFIHRIFCVVQCIRVMLIADLILPAPLTCKSDAPDSFPGLSYQGVKAQAGWNCHQRCRVFAIW